MPLPAALILLGFFFFPSHTSKREREKEMYLPNGRYIFSCSVHFILGGEAVRLKHDSSVKNRAGLMCPLLIPALLAFIHNGKVAHLPLSRQRFNGRKGGKKIAAVITC